MRNQLAVMRNVVALRSAFDALAGRDAGVPGMGLVCGNTGYGKTTAIAWLVNQVRGIYARANATWTPSAMLGALMKEIGAEPLHSRNSIMVDYIIGKLSLDNRPLFIDESDYLFSNLKMLETLRDIHDASGVPVMLIGMEGIERRLVHRKQLARRVSQWIEFRPADLSDARTLTNTVCEVEISDDMLERLHSEARGNVGLMVVGLARIETLAKANGWKSLDLDRWGARQLFLSRAPKVREAA